MELLSNKSITSQNAPSFGISILTDRVEIAEGIAARINALPNSKLITATNSLVTFQQAIEDGDTDIELVSYRSLNEYAQLEENLGSTATYSTHRYVMSWVATYEINEWVARHGFTGVITHFDFSCRSSDDLVQLLIASQQSDVLQGSQSEELKIGPISYKDHVDEEIAAMISSGMSDREIADTLYLSLQTIRNRVSRMLHDSGVKNRTHLAMVYLTTLQTFVK